MLLYARIKGVDETRLAAVANQKMQQMDLTLFRSVKVCRCADLTVRHCALVCLLVVGASIRFFDMCVLSNCFSSSLSSFFGCHACLPSVCIGFDVWDLSVPYGVAP